MTAKSGACLQSIPVKGKLAAALLFKSGLSFERCIILVPRLIYNPIIVARRSSVERLI